MDTLDILNRDKFVKQLVNLVENISDNKAFTCFAINGKWGCGKSFVLDMFEKELGQIQSEETSREKYFIIRYNSWKYDYYEEPLIAFVSTIISTIEEKTKFFPDSEEKREIIGMFKAAGVSLLSFASLALKEKTGIDLKKAYEIIRDGEKAGAAEYEKEHDYDVYFNFKKVIEELSSLMQDLAKDYTVIILVDELDRCIPEYAIKVLERLHHLVEGNSNIITILAIDKTQLMSSVKQTFGFEKPEKYLEKFFSFEVGLDCGTVSEKITEKYKTYIELFDKDIFPCNESLEECLQMIFKDVEIRTQEQIVKKAMISHKLLFSNSKDYTFLCMELIIAVMISVYGYSSIQFENPLYFNGFDEFFISCEKTKMVSFSKDFKEKCDSINFKRSHSFPDEPTKYVLPDTPNLYAAIAYTWSWLHDAKHANTILQYSYGGIYSIISKNYEELKKFIEVISMMN